MPIKPLLKKPPLDHRLWMPVGCPPLPIPQMMIPIPAAIMMMMVATLKKENQNSSSPNTFTLIRLMAPITSTTLSTQIQ
ncbi:hypothetical protein D3C72_1616340 [compost metagenome]